MIPTIFISFAIRPTVEPQTGVGKSSHYEIRFVRHSVFKEVENEERKKRMHTSLGLGIRKFMSKFMTIGQEV